MLQEKVREVEKIAGQERLRRLQGWLASHWNLAPMTFRVGAVRAAVPAIQRMSVASMLQALRQESLVCVARLLKKTESDMCEFLEW